MQENRERRLKDDYAHLEDLALKTAAQFFGEELLPYVGVKEKVSFQRGYYTSASEPVDGRKNGSQRQNSAGA